VTRAFKAVLPAAAGLLLISCSRRAGEQNVEAASARPVGAATPIVVPLGLPPVPVPADNPVTVETIDLGRRLFYEKRLSANNTIACASCHDPLRGFSDGRKFSTGVDGKTGTRNAPTVLNAAYAGTLFWDGRASSLEEQAAGPIQNPIEMNQTHEVCVSKLGEDPAYVAEFENAFGPGPITMDKVQKALAAFERTVLSANSAFDRYEFGGDKNALSAAAARGLAIFKDRNQGNCATCHTIAETHALFSDGKFHNIGIGVNPEGELTDPGRFNHTGVETDRGAFKTPTLRNVAESAPYMHDGSLKTLRDVVDFYTGGGNSNPHLDKEIKPLNLTRRQRDDLVSFLESLTGEVPQDVGPPSK
jgi:cytochrome c peroxidase